MANDMIEDTNFNSIHKRSFALRSLLTDLEKRYKGYIQTGVGDKWVKVNKPMMTEELRNKIIGLLSPYASDVNLISVKDQRDADYEIMIIHQRINETMLMDDGYETRDYNNIITMAVSTLVAIYDVVLSSRPLMQDYLVGREEPNEEKNDGY